MRFVHRHLGVYFDVHVHEIPISHLANHAFFDAIGSRDFCGYRHDLLSKSAAWRLVHKFTERWPEQTPSVPRNETRCKDCGDIVRSLVAFSTKKSDTDADCCGNGSNVIAPVMPRVRDHGSAFD